PHPAGDVAALLRLEAVAEAVKPGILDREIRVIARPVGRGARRVLLVGDLEDVQALFRVEYSFHVFVGQDSHAVSCLLFGGRGWSVLRRLGGKPRAGAARAS